MGPADAHQIAPAHTAAAPLHPPALSVVPFSRSDVVLPFYRYPVLPSSRRPALTARARTRHR